MGYYGNVSESQVSYADLDGRVTLVDMDPDAAVGQRLAELRNMKGLRQEDFLELLDARGIKWTQSTLSRVESGKRALKATELFATADALDIETGELNPVRNNLFRLLQRRRVRCYEVCTAASRAAADAAHQRKLLTALTLAMEINDGRSNFTVRGTADNFRSLLISALIDRSMFNRDAARELFGFDRVDQELAAAQLASPRDSKSLLDNEFELRQVYNRVFASWLPPSIEFKPNPDDRQSFSVDGIDVEDGQSQLPYLAGVNMNAWGDSDGG